MASSEKYPITSIFEDAQRPGSWIARVTFAANRSVRRRATSRKAAEAKAKELVKRHALDLNAAGGDQALETFVNVWWRQAIEPRGLAPKTLADYRDTLERYVLPHIGTIKVAAIDALMVIDLFHKLSKRHSPSTAHRALTQLHSVLDAARRWRIIPFNPVADARKDLPARVVADTEPLTIAQTLAVLAAVEGHRLADLYYVALILGLRLGELLGLQWTDINWTEATLTIRRQAQDVGGRKQLRDATKTRAGARVLPIPPRLLARLQDRKRAAMFIFPNEDGGMLSPGNFERHWRGGRAGKRKADGTDKRVMGMRDKAGVPDYVTPHTFRHTVATRLLEQGVAEEHRAALLGHGKKTITQRYSHATMGALRAAVAQLEATMYGDTNGDILKHRSDTF